MDTGAPLSAFGGVVAVAGLRSDGGSLGTGFGALRVTGLAAETEEMGASSDERSGGGGLALGFFALAVSNISTLSVPPGDCDCLRAGEPRGGEVGEPTKRAWWRAAIASTAAWRSRNKLGLPRRETCRKLLRNDIQTRADRAKARALVARLLDEPFQLDKVWGASSWRRFRGARARRPHTHNGWTPAAIHHRRVFTSARPQHFPKQPIEPWRPRNHVKHNADGARPSACASSSTAPQLSMSASAPSLSLLRQQAAAISSGIERVYAKMHERPGLGPLLLLRAGRTF